MTTDEERRQDLVNRFNYHAPSPEAKVHHEKVREILLEVAVSLTVLVPAGREQAVVLTKIEEAMFWANAGIARNHDKLTQ